MSQPPKEGGRSIVPKALRLLRHKHFPEGWSNNKNVVFSGTSLWIGLVFLVGILILSFLKAQFIIDQKRKEPSPRILSDCRAHSKRNG